MANYDLVIFDFDGTLADTRQIIIMAKQEANVKLGLPFRDEEACAATIGLTAEAGLLKMYPDLTPEQVKAGALVYRELFERHKRETPPVVFPNVRETLETLRKHGVRMSVASSRTTPSLMDFLRSMELAPFFDLILGSNDTKKYKPDPEPVLLTLSKLGFAPERTLVVGDMPYDVLMGRNAGTEACGVTYGNASAEDLWESGANEVIDDFAALTKIVIGE